MSKSLYEWLDQIEARSGMHLSAASFAVLKTFIAGYEVASMTQRSVEHCELPFMSRFLAIISQATSKRERDG
jgi:hypothetical protein